MQYRTITGFSISAVDLFQSLCSIDTIIRKVWHLNELNVLQLVSYLVCKILDLVIPTSWDEFIFVWISVLFLVWSPPGNDFTTRMKCPKSPERIWKNGTLDLVGIRHSKIWSLWTCLFCQYQNVNLDLEESEMEEVLILS